MVSVGPLKGAQGVAVKVHWEVGTIWGWARVLFGGGGLVRIGGGGGGGVR